MRYVLDHDLHIHSQLSTCSGDPEQNPERILAHAEKYNLKTLCLTDHFWDDSVPGASRWYQVQNFEHINQANPLPQSDKTKFLFGCETELDRFFTLGLAPEHYDLFDFIIIPTTHLHMVRFALSEEDSASFERRAQLWIDRFDAVLDMPLPFHKVGIAHLACEYTGFPSRDNFLQIFDMIPSSEMERLFTKAAKLGVGIELNFGDMRNSFKAPDIVLRPFRIAKQCGCKFYFGSDAHHPQGLEDSIPVFEQIIDILQIEESDKFHIS